MDGTFEDVTPVGWLEDIHPNMGFAYADYDKDGKVDYALGRWNEGYALFHNETEGQSDWLRLRLSGGGPVNRDAIGARVYLTLSDGRTLMQEVKSGSSLGAGNDTALHFGLGQAEILSLRATWPDGARMIIDNPPVNRELHLGYPFQ